ncbi:MAG: hypothetical protein O2854_02000 [Chloroflexi bacterium]|nr:hypothetical protein [Chloroflexota bacterium]
MSTLRGTKEEDHSAAAAPKAPIHHVVAPQSQSSLRLVRPWEAVARDGRDFAEKGAGMMYWFKVPLGGICYPEGFRSFLQPALMNENISKIRFILDAANPLYYQIWHEQVLPLQAEWAEKEGREFTLDAGDMGGKFSEAGGAKSVEWVFIDLSAEFSPCFKLFVDDPDNNMPVHPDAQIFLSTAQRQVRFKDGSFSAIRIPDAILRVGDQDDQALLHALNSLANQWDPLFV